MRLKALFVNTVKCQTVSGLLKVSDLALLQKTKKNLSKKGLSANQLASYFILWSWCHASYEFYTISTRAEKAALRIECVRCHAIKNKIKNYATDKVTKL